MKSVCYCALTVFTLAAWTTLSWAGDGCCNGGCGQKSVQAASCCDDCCKPSFCDRIKARFHKNDCCQPACEQPKCCEKPKCDDCCKPSFCERLKARFHKNDCCNTCDSCGSGAVTTIAPAPAAPAKAPEAIPAPMPK